MKQQSISFRYLVLALVSCVRVDYLMISFLDVYLAAMDTRANVSL